jgi:hypothetical protein
VNVSASELRKNANVNNAYVIGNNSIENGRGIRPNGNDNKNWSDWPQLQWLQHKVLRRTSDHPVAVRNTWKGDVDPWPVTTVIGIVIERGSENENETSATSTPPPHTTIIPASLIENDHNNHNSHHSPTLHPLSNRVHPTCPLPPASPRLQQRRRQVEVYTRATSCLPTAVARARSMEGEQEGRAVRPWEPLPSRNNNMD